MSLAIVGLPEAARAQEPAPRAPAAGQLEEQQEVPEAKLSPEPEPSAEPAASAGALLDEESEAPTPGARVISLNEAIAIALERNFGLLSGNDSVLSARYREQTSRAQFYPRLTPRYQRSEGASTYGADLSQRLPFTGGTASASGTFRSLEDSGASPAGKSSDLRLTVSQPLLRGFGPNTAYYDLRNSQRALVGQERSYELQRQRLAIDVTAAFYQIVKQRSLLGVSRQSLKRSNGLREASEARMKVGLASKLDVFRAELQASQTEDSLVQSRALLDGALENFRLLLGLAPSEPLEPESQKLPEELRLVDLEATDALVKRALATRLELKEARDQVRDAERTLSLSRQNLLPQLDVGLLLARAGFGPSFGNALDVADTRVSLFLSTSYPLERSSDKANKAIAELDLDARKRALAQREMEVEADVRSALRALDRIRKSIELQSKSVALSEQQLRLATLRYQRGLASNFDVVDAEGSLVSARTALVGLLTDHEVARVQLLRAVGTLDVAREFQP
jgi:outer membrane protein TolC